MWRRSKAEEITVSMGELSKAAERMSKEFEKMERSYTLKFGDWETRTSKPSRVTNCPICTWPLEFHPFLAEYICSKCGKLPPTQLDSASQVKEEKVFGNQYKLVLDNVTLIDNNFGNLKGFLLDSVTKHDYSKLPSFAKEETRGFLKGVSIKYTYNEDGTQKNVA